MALSRRVSVCPGWWHVGLGITAGLIGAALVLALLEPAHVDVAGEPGALLSDCDGTLCSLAIHYVVEAGDVVAPTYRDFLTRLPGGITVYVVCRDAAAFADFQQRIGTTACQLKMVAVAHPLTTWSRDRWLAVQARGGGQTTLLCPRQEKAHDIWPARDGDARVGFDLQRELAPSVRARRCSLWYDGGDFVADEHTVFVTPDVAVRNVQQTVESEAELRGMLEQVLHRRVVLLEDSPPYHAGMFMMTAGQGVVLVGDPAGAQRILSASPGELPDGLCPPHGPDFSAATAARFDAVAEQCRRSGYRVVRIPVVPGLDARTYVTYVNVIIDQRPEGRWVYMPVFAGCEALNQAARQVWEELGYRVQPVDCTRCSRYFGSLRCLVNVVRRTDLRSTPGRSKSAWSGQE